MSSNKNVVTWNDDPAHFRKSGRREFLRVGVVGALGLTLGDFFKMRARADLKHYESKEGPAKSVIQIVLPGGMAHQESWDPKPDAPLEYRGPFAVAKTKLPGVVFNENFRELAKVADKLTVIRSIAGKEADHGRASYTMYTGYRKSPAIEHPSLGAVVSHESALSVHDLGDVNPARTHLTVPRGFRQRPPGGVVLHQGVLPEGDVRDQEGFRVTTPLRSLLDTAAGDLDLDLLAGAIHDALEKGVLTRSRLLARAEELGPRAALRIERALHRGAG